MAVREAPYPFCSWSPLDASQCALDAQNCVAKLLTPPSQARSHAAERNLEQRSDLRGGQTLDLIQHESLRQFRVHLRERNVEQLQVSVFFSRIARVCNALVHVLIELPTQQLTPE